MSCPRCNLPDDYIPGGPKVYSVVNVREVPQDEFARCCRVVGDDMQSGPLYCGDRATLMADSSENQDHHVYVCKRHDHGLRAIEKK